MQRKQSFSRLGLFVGTSISVSILVFGLASPPLGQARSQAGSAAQQNAAAAPQSFEVASIKPSAAQGGMVVRMGMGLSPGGRYTASGVTVKMLIQQAYDLKDYQISGGPSWISTERYDIVAKAETPNITREQLRVLLQSLLAERFNLKIRRETKQLPIYALVVAKNGPKLNKSETQPGAGADAKLPDLSKVGDPGTAPVIKMGGAGGGGVTASGGGAGVGGASGAVMVMSAGSGGKGASMMRMGPGQLSAQGAPISTLVMLLSQQLGRPVMDKTGLEGNFDFNLQYSPDETQRGLGVGGLDRPDMAPPADASGPSIFTALQDQLGLKLESQKGPVEILVIEHIERPSPD